MLCTIYGSLGTVPLYTHSTIQINSCFIEYLENKKNKNYNNWVGSIEERKDKIILKIKDIEP